MKQKASSSSIKYTGDKNVVPGATKMSPQDRAERFAGGRVRVENMWGKSPLLAIVDDSISHFAFRVRSLFAVPTLQGGAIALSYQEIAEAMSCSERQANRVIEELESQGYIEVSRKHNLRNAYTLRDSFQLVDGLSTGPIRIQRRGVPAVCVKCRRLCGSLPVNRTCRTCNGDVKFDRKLDRKLDERGVPRKATA